MTAPFAQLPATGEDLASALAATGAAPFDEVLGSATKRQLARCDAVLRTVGDSEIADRVVELARWEVYRSTTTQRTSSPVYGRKST